MCPILASNWFQSHEYVAIWLEGIALVLIFVWDRIDSNQQNEETLKQRVLTQRSLDASIATERAWVMVDLEKSSRQGFIIEGSSNGKQHVSVTVKFICNNQGKTPAKILEKRVCLWLLRLEHALPETPDFEIDSGDPTPHFLGAADKFEREWTAQTEGVPSRDSTMVIYGFVKYQHLFSEHEVRTTFGYQIMPASNRLVRLSKAKYNEIT